MENYVDVIKRISDHTLNLAFKYCEDDVLKGDKEARRWIRWDWSMGVAFYGIMKAYDETGDESYIKRTKIWVDSKIDKIEYTCVNTCALLNTVLKLYNTFGDEKYKEICMRFDEYLMKKSLRTSSGAIVHSVIGEELNGQVWADTLFMSIIYLAKRGFKDEALRQLKLHIECLFDGHTGLFYHGYSDDIKKPMGVKWGRGNAWVTASIVDILEQIPGDFADRQYVLKALSKQLDSLEKYQNDSGSWNTVIDSRDTYAETSVTAGMAYGVLKAIRLGFIKPHYGEMAQKALNALKGCVDVYGNVTGGSTGTAIKEDSLNYNLVPQRVTPFTQGLALMAFTEANLSKI